MKTSENSHKTILKTTGVFGFSQALKMLIGVVGVKFAAIFLGPAGIGVLGLLKNTLAIISSVTSFGLPITSVRELSLFTSEKQVAQFSKKFIILNRYAIVIGVLGGVLTFFSSSYLSEFTFGNKEYQLWFQLLSLNFILSSLTTTRTALLQSKRMIKSIAVSSLVISLLTTIITIPIYYFFKIKGIVPVLLLSGFIGLIVNLYYTRNITFTKTKVSIKETINSSSSLVKLGFLLSINVIFGQICTYIIKLYLNNSGSSMEIVGIYEVSTVILISYVGMIFSAMSTDFYPRLTTICHDITKTNNLVNDQIEIALLIITPAIALLYLCAPVLIQILYSKDFLGVLFIFKAALFAIIIKAIIWPLAYIILSKGENRLYFKQELLGDSLNIFFTILFYNLWGLIGIGLASLMNFTIYGIYVYFILESKFNFSLRKDTLKIVIISCFIGLSDCLTSFFSSNTPTTYSLQFLILVFSCFFSYKELDKRIQIATYLSKIKNRFKK